MLPLAGLSVLPRLVRYSAPLAALVAALSGCASVASGLDVDERARGPLFEAQRAAEHPGSLHFINRWTLTARVLVAQGSERERLGMKWSFERDHFSAPSRQRIQFYGRLGRSVLTVYADETGATVEKSRLQSKADNAHDLSTLIEANTGVLIPAEQLPRWLQGLDLPGSTLTNLGVVYTFDQWRVEYLAFDDYGGWLMPRQVKVANDKVELTITVTQWKLPSPSSTQKSNFGAPVPYTACTHSLTVAHCLSVAPSQPIPDSGHRRTPERQTRNPPLVQSSQSIEPTQTSHLIPPSQLSPLSHLTQASHLIPPSHLIHRSQLTQLIPPSQASHLIPPSHLIHRSQLTQLIPPSQASHLIQPTQLIQPSHLIPPSQLSPLSHLIPPSHLIQSTQLRQPSHLAQPTQP